MSTNVRIRQMHTLGTQRRKHLADRLARKLAKDLDGVHFVTVRFLALGRFNDSRHEFVLREHKLQQLERRITKRLGYEAVINTNAKAWPIITVTATRK